MMWTLHHLFNGFKDVMQNIWLWKFWRTLDGSIRRFTWIWGPLVWTFYLVWKYELCLMYVWRHCNAQGCCSCCLFSFAHLHVWGLGMFFQYDLFHLDAVIVPVFLSFIRICNFRCMLMFCMTISIFEMNYHHQESHNTGLKKAQKMCFMSENGNLGRQISGFRLWSTFFRGTTENVLTGKITNWHGSCMAQDRRPLQQQSIGESKRY